jgi:hypothetical protein
MKTRPFSRTNSKQRGAALAIAMILLVGITVVSVAALNTGTLELMMAGNEESKMNAFQRAQDGIDATSSLLGNFVVFGNVGFKNCTPGFTTKYGTTCNQNSVTFPDAYDATNTEVLIERESPALRCPPRGMATSCETFSVATFSMDSRHDNTASRGGRTELVQGFLVLVPGSDQGN